MDYYNDDRYPFEHFGLTPYEVLDGEILDKFRFTEQIRNRQKNGSKKIEHSMVVLFCAFSRSVRFMVHERLFYFDENQNFTHFNENWSILFLNQFFYFILVTFQS